MVRLALETFILTSIAANLLVGLVVWGLEDPPLTTEHRALARSGLPAAMCLVEWSAAAGLHVLGSANHRDYSPAADTMRSIWLNSATASNLQLWNV